MLWSKQQQQQIYLLHVRAREDPLSVAGGGDSGLGDAAVVRTALDAEVTSLVQYILVNMFLCYLMHET